MKGSWLLSAAVVTVAVALLIAASVVSARTGGRRGGFETGSFSEFDGGPSVLRGTLVTTRRRAFAGRWSARGYSDGSRGNSFSRVTWNVAYRSGQRITYGASFYLPGRLPCWAMLARWDNFALFRDEGDTGGVELERGVIRLVRMDYAGTNYARLSPSVPVPRRRWFSVTVVQRLGSSGASNAFYLDGRLIGRSTTPNSRGRRITNIRFGMVATGGPCAGPTSFYLDRVFAR